jgi:hypothetical protein
MAQLPEVYEVPKILVILDGEIIERTDMKNFMQEIME